MFSRAVTVYIRVSKTYLRWRYLGKPCVYILTNKTYQMGLPFCCQGMPRLRGTWGSEENGGRNNFRINLHESMLRCRDRTPGSVFRHISAVIHITDCATRPSGLWLWYFLVLLICLLYSWTHCKHHIKIWASTWDFATKCIGEQWECRQT